MLHRRPRPLPLLTVVLLAFLTAWTSPGASASAQDVPDPSPIVIEEPGHMVVQAALCTDASCNEFSGYLDMFLITAVDPDTGEEFSSCATDNLQQNLDHQCILDIPADGDVELQWFEGQVPNGYVPFGEPFPVGEPVVMTLGFYPEADEASIAPTPAAVTTLPSTGTGPDSDATLIWSATLALAAGLVPVIAGVAHFPRATPEPARQTATRHEHES